MTAVTRPRGPLPARVYWTRRLLVVVVALGLVFGVARLLGSGGGGGGPSATPVGAEPSANATTSSAPPPTASGTITPSPTVTATPTPSVTAKTRTKAGKTPSATPLASPDGNCESSDIVAVPTLTGPAYAGRRVVFSMSLTTKESPACSWTVSSDALAVKVTSGSDRLWSTQQCTAAIPRTLVVVRKDHPTLVPVTWSGQRSDNECSRATSWAEPGYYHAVAAALGGDPTDEQFELVAPPRRTVTATPTPTATPKGKQSSSATPSRKAKPKPSSSPR
jgi:hypothetical protein